MADKELPPLYVKILGDASGFQKTISETLAAATNADKAISRSKDAEFEREFTNYMLLQKSKDIGVANAISNINLLRKIEDAKFEKELHNEILLEKQRAINDAIAQAEFNREFNNLVLLMRQREIADAKQIQNEIILQKIKDQAFDKEFLNELLLEKQRKLADEKEFQNELLLEKQREAARQAAENQRIAELKWNSKLLEDQMRSIEAEKQAQIKAAEDKRMADIKWNSKILEDKMKALEAERQQIEKNRIAELKWNSKILEDQQKADARARQEEIDKYMEDLKWNSRLLEDKMKAEQTLAAAQERKRIADLKWNSKLLEDQQKAADAQQQASIDKYMEDLKWNSKLLEDKMRADKALADAQEQKRIEDLKWNSKLLEDQQKAEKALADEQERKRIADLKWNSKLLEDQQKAEEKRISDHEKLVAKMIADVRKYEQEQKKSWLRNFYVNMKFNSKVMEDQEKAAKRAADAKIREEQRVARERERLAKKSVSVGASGLGSGLTARADIYMHTNAIQSVMRHSKSLIELYSNYTQAKAGLEAFAGSAQKTDEILKDMRDFAQKTPYSLAELTQETKNMMARGMAADEATEAIKRLGAVAGGDVNRLSHLALAFAQISTKGKLMQQDLNQLTEQGFNPLYTIAEKSLRPNQSLKQRMEELTQAKEEGLITSQHVMDALKVETSLGGRYADLLNKMSGEVGGLTSRLREMFDEVKLDAMKLLDEEMKNTLKTAIHYVGILKKWIAENKETAKSIVESAVAAGKSILAFHLLGLAVAALRWWMSSAVATIYALRFALLPLVGVMYLLSAATMMASVSMRIFSFGMMLSNAVAASLFVTMGGVGLATNAVTVATLRNAVASRLAATATLVLSAAMSALRISAVGVQIAFARAWIAFLGPISLAVGAVALVIAVIWNLVDVVLNGLGGSFGRVWESMKMFFMNAYGFFMNFGNNIKVLTKYVYENWQNLFSDMLTIVGAFVLALPQNIFTMWKMGMRLTWAFGSWLISYLPTAIYNAFAAGFKFVKTLFSQLLDAGKAVWEFITNPSKWASGAGSVMEFISKLGSDTKSAAENGFVETAKNIIDEERKNLTTGLQGTTLSSPSIKGLKFDVPQEEKEKPPEPDMLPPPEAFNPDFSGIGAGMGEGAKGGSRYQVQDAISVQSGDYTKKMAAYMDTIRGMKAASTDPNLAAQQKANQLLQRIEKNTAKQGPAIQAVDL